MSVRFRVLIAALLVLGLYGVAVATVQWNGGLEVQGNLKVDGTCTGCGGSPIESHTASTSNSLNFTCPSNSSFNEFRFEIQNLVPTTAGLNLWIQMGTGGGPTYDTGNNYSWLGWRNISNSQGAGGNTGVSGIQFDSSAIDTLSNSSTFGFVGNVILYNPASTSLFKSVTGGPFHFLTNASTREEGFSSGVYEQTTAVTAIRFFSGTFGTNTIASGAISCYGIS